jgi:glycosyltransferase involved in cell wall biosynthesis
VSLVASQRPRILQVCAVDFTAFHLLRPLLRATRDAGYEAEFSCSDGPGAAALREEGFAYRQVDMARSGAIHRNVRAIASLAASLRRDRPDIVHTHTPIGGIVGRAAAVLANSRHVVHTFHGLAYATDDLTPAQRLFLQAERLLAHHTDYFFSQGANDATRAVDLGIASADRIAVIGNGIDLDRFHPDREVRESVRVALDIPTDAVIAVMVSRLIREKGVLDLADAAIHLEDVPGLHFIVIGEALPSDRDPVTAELDAHRVVGVLKTRWRRLGYRADVERLIQSADVFVLPSYREGLPRSLIEAMACGVPAITTNIPAGRELVEDGINGILVPPGDTGALARALRRLATEPAARRSMAVRAREIALQRHDERKVLDRQLRVFEQLLAT